MIARDHPLAERILSLVPINSLDARLQNQALAQGELLEFKRRKKVFQAGARDPHTFYLLDGELELQAQGASPMRMRAGDENARRALAQLQPRRYTARALNNVTVFRIERAVLDHILADEQMFEDTGGQMDVHEIEEEQHEDGADWMTRLLGSELFIRLPNENIQRFFTELEPIEYEQGSCVVEQGTPGDYLYIVAEGRCSVVRRTPGAAQEVQLAVLKEGDSFGEEALLTGSPRNASVRMLSDGMMMRLTKQAFEELLSNPTLKAVPWSEGCKQVKGGALWVDVRFPDEHQTHAIEHSLNVPLNALRLQANKLARDKRYVIYCDTGVRSAAGAFLLARLGFEVCYLAGGLERTPLGSGGAGAATPQPAPAPEAEEQTPPDSFEFEFVTGAAPPTEAPQPDAVQRTDTAPPTPTAPPTRSKQPTDKAEPADAASAASTPDAPGTPAQPVSAPAGEAQPATSPSAPAAPKPASAPSPDGPPARPTPDMAEIRAHLAKLKAERDQATAYAKKAADAAREFKRRAQEATQHAEQSRNQREALEKKLAALNADAQRAESLEVARLSGESEKLSKRLEAVQRELVAERESNTAQRERLQAKLVETDAQLAALAKGKQQVRTQQVAAEAAFEDALLRAREETAGLKSRLESLDAELASTRDRLTEAEARGRAAAEDRAAHSVDAQAALREVETRVQAQAQQLELDRTRAQQELEQLERARHEHETQLRTERAAIDAEVSTQRAFAEALDQRERELGDARAALDARVGEREAELDRRAAALGQEAEELSAEKAAWKQTVEEAIAQERARLEADYARYREQVEAQAHERAESLAEERASELRAEFEANEAQLRIEFETREAETQAGVETREADLRASFKTREAELIASFEAREAELRASFEARESELQAASQAREAALLAVPEAREAQMRTQVEAHVAKLLAEFDARLARIRSGYETRLAEQEAILEDERRRLETEVVRLREALADARNATPSTVPVRSDAAMAPPAPDVELDTHAASELARDPPAASARSASMPKAGPHPAQDLDLELDEARTTSSPSAEPPASSVLPELDLELDLDEVAPQSAPFTRDAQPENTIPVIELLDERAPAGSRTEQVADAPGRDSQWRPVSPEEAKRRVISQAQLADIRKRMQEKMRAAKTRAN